MVGKSHPGNDHPRRGRRWTEALKRALARLGKGDVDKGLDRLASRMVNAADQGDIDAALVIMERLGDRLEGKPGLQVSTDEEGREVLQLTARVQLVAVTQHIAPALQDIEQDIRSPQDTEPQALVQLIDPKGSVT